MHLKTHKINKKELNKHLIAYYATKTRTDNVQAFFFKLKNKISIKPKDGRKIN